MVDAFAGAKVAVPGSAGRGSYDHRICGELQCEVSMLYLVIDMRECGASAVAARPTEIHPGFYVCFTSGMI